jgi:HD-GYP domain-containing protein (c-di-GMP phosphodiesterase class II)
VEAVRSDDQIRLAGVMASLSLATDLGLGQPLEHELGVSLSALELADRLGCSADECSDVYYVALLAHIGCTAAAPYFASWVGGDEIHFQSGVQVLGPASEPAEDIRYLVRRLADDRPVLERASLVAKQLVGGKKQFEIAAANLCEGGRLLARGLHLSDEVARALGQMTTRWDGKGVPHGVGGAEISRALRIVRVAHDLVAIAHAADLGAATGALTRRRGRGYDPQVVEAALADPVGLVRVADAPDAWERVIAAEPEPVGTISSSGLEMVARAFAEFTDLKVGFLRGHSTRVAELAANAAEALGCSRSEASQVRAAGLFHDLGRVSVPNGIWEKRDPLSAGEWERVRLHPYYTERVLEHSPALAPLADLAGSHHERLDGSGYHRGATAAQLGVGARLRERLALVSRRVAASRHRQRAGDPRGARGRVVARGRRRGARHDRATCPAGSGRRLTARVPRADQSDGRRASQCAQRAGRGRPHHRSRGTRGTRLHRGSARVSPGRCRFRALARIDGAAASYAVM